MKFKIKRKDKVVIISGKDKGKVGEVMELIPGDGFDDLFRRAGSRPNGLFASFMQLDFTY